MAYRCMDMVSGDWLHLPEPGSMMEQTVWIMECVEQARRAWLIWQYKPANKIEWTPEDGNFMAWVGDGTN